MDSFCALPWKHLDIARNGEARVCCNYQGPIRSPNGSPMNVHEQTVEEIWNSPYMRKLREDMVAGQMVPECAYCNKLEAAGLSSYRQQVNQIYASDDEKVKTLKNLAESDDYWLATFPSYFLLHGGTTCNLKCRMCSGGSAATIESDPVHGKWNGGSAPPKEERWYSDPEIIRQNVLRFPDQVENIELIGGETFLLKEVEIILQYLVDMGVAHKVTFSATTNATVPIPRWFALSKHFRSTYLMVSIDGFEKDYEYIRYPAKWETLINNVHLLKEMSNLTMSVNVMVQNYNIMNLASLCRYLDSLDLPYLLTLLEGPPFLQPTMIPPAARQLAAARLRQFAQTDCREENREAVLGIARQLDEAGDAVDAEMMRHFMLFTNDLDVTRGQSFRHTHAELFALIEEAGFVWTDETRYARQTLPLLTVAD